MTRLLTILALVLGHWAPPAVSASLPAMPCRDASCCTVVRHTTCCGETVTMRCCGRTGRDECRCGVRPDHAPAAPEAPAPAPDGTARILSLPASPSPLATTLAVGLPRAADSMRSIIVPAAAPARRCAERCVWRI